MRLMRSEDESPEVQMAPLIDCVFLLLIFFLVATTLKKRIPELPLELPLSGASTLAPVESDLFAIGLDRHGQRYVNGQPVTLEMLHRNLRERAQTHPGGKVRIDADRDARYGDLIELIDLCRFEGLTNIAFHTRAELKRR